MRWSTGLVLASMCTVCGLSGAVSADTLSYGDGSPDWDALLGTELTAPVTVGDAVWRSAVNEPSGGWREVTTAGLREVTELAQVVEDFAMYSAAVLDDYQTITFVGDTGTAGMVLAEQYEGVGVNFPPDSGDTILWIPGGTVFEDDFGVNGNGDVEVRFTESQRHLAVDYAGAVKFWLYKGDSLVYESPALGDSGVGKFAGVILDEVFDRAVIEDPVDGYAVIDNLYYNVIPEPGTIICLAGGAFAFAASRRRSRRGC